MLPGIDDGAQELKDTAGLFEQSVKQGIREIAFTPHFYPEHIDFESFVAGRDNAVKSVQPLVEKYGIRFRVGAEIRFTPFLSELPLEKLAYSGTRYLLLELPWTNEPFGVIDLIRRIRDRDYIPILAHIERCPYLKEDTELLYRWESAGALAQINANWILSDRKAKKTVEKLCKYNLVHIMASDAHSIEKRPQNLISAYRLLPQDIAKRLWKNSLLIFDGRDLKEDKPIRPQRSFSHWT